MLYNINAICIEQVNKFKQIKNKYYYFYFSKFKKTNKFINTFDKVTLIIENEKKRQVNQRQYRYRLAKIDYLMHMDDDIFINFKNLKILLNQFQNLSWTHYFKFI